MYGKEDKFDIDVTIKLHAFCLSDLLFHFSDLLFHFNDLLLLVT